MKIEEEYADVLHNIEMAILTVYEGNTELTDSDVLKAIDLLMNAYEREKRGRVGVTPMPSGRANAVYEQCRRICEWQLGRQLLNENEAGNEGAQGGDLTLPGLMLCLKRIRKSIRMWHKEGGRQGYLSYVSDFLADANSRLGF
jgi:hypothetical protein